VVSFSIICPVIRAGEMSRRNDNLPMLTNIYIEALLVDERLADQVWELWRTGLVSEDLAALAWWLVASA
jgi:hypothetical protein